MKYCTVCKAKYDDKTSFCPVDGEVLEDDLSSFVNTVLDGQYQIEAMLGKGGMGAVYRARHILLGDRVAIKILPAEVRNNPEWLRRFRREGQAARRFRHPNAVTVYDLRTASDGTIYMVMEYVEGHTLDAEIKKRGRFTPADSLKTLEPILSVLHTAHAMGVVHRDLKPDNIMISTATTGGEPSVKLLDLGIAKMREIAGAEATGTTALTLAGQVLGTPYYMSPEQWGELPSDENSEIDGRADIYSLGLVFYEMITGKRPVSGLTLHELRREHIESTPPPLYEVNSEVPRAFSDAIACAIAKDRSDRPATAGELAAQLRDALGVSGAAGEAGATFPEIPLPEESKARTVEPAKLRQTRSDSNAPTILTSDSVPTVGSSAIPEPYSQAPPEITVLPVSNYQESAPTIAQPGGLESSATVPRQALSGHPRARSASLFVGIGLGVIALFSIVVMGFFAVRWWSISGPSGNNNTSNTSESTTVEPKPGIVTHSEVGHYWLELLANNDNNNSLRVAGVVPMASGQLFKFHFVFGSDGYLYIVGPGERNEPTAFLTDKPPAGSGLESNRVMRGVDFSYPNGSDHWLALDKKPGTESYTVLFSREPLNSPPFLASQATGRPFREAEKSSWELFLSQNRTVKPVIELNDVEGIAPFVTIKVPEPDLSVNPIIFEIRIQHK